MSKILTVSAVLSVLSGVILIILLIFVVDKVVITKEYKYIGANGNYHYYWDNKEVKEIDKDTNIFIEDGVIKINEEEYVDDWKSTVFYCTLYILIVSALTFYVIALILPHLQK